MAFEVKHFNEAGELEGVDVYGTIHRFSFDPLTTRIVDSSGERVSTLRRGQRVRVFYRKLTATATAAGIVAMSTGPEILPGSQAVSDPQSGVSLAIPSGWVSDSGWNIDKGRPIAAFAGPQDHRGERPVIRIWLTEANGETDVRRIFGLNRSLPSGTSQTRLVDGLPAALVSMQPDGSSQMWALIFALRGRYLIIAMRSEGSKEAVEAEFDRIIKSISIDPPQPGKEK